MTGSVVSNTQKSCTQTDRFFFVIIRIKQLTKKIKQIVNLFSVLILELILKEFFSLPNIRMDFILLAKQNTK